MEAGDKELARPSIAPGMGAPASPSFGGMLGPGRNPLEQAQAMFSMREYRQGPPMERLRLRQKALQQERDMLIDRLNKVEAAIKLLESQPELNSTLDALAECGVL